MASGESLLASDTTMTGVLAREEIIARWENDEAGECPTLALSKPVSPNNQLRGTLGTVTHSRGYEACFTFVCFLIGFIELRIELTGAREVLYP